MVVHDCRCGSEFCSICNPEDYQDEKITVNMTDDDYESLMQMFVESSLCKEAVGTYHDYINDGSTVTEALSRAVVNEMVVRALVDKIEREKFEETLNNKQE